MKRRREIKKAVYEILEKDEYARVNDEYLKMRVVQELEPELAGTSYVNVQMNLTFKGISGASITRARRDFFEKFPDLKVERAERARRCEELAYHMEYARR